MVQLYYFEEKRHHLKTLFFVIVTVSDFYLF